MLTITRLAVVQTPVQRYGRGSMGSDVQDSAISSVGAFGLSDDPEDTFITNIGDPFGVFGVGAADDIQEEGERARARVRNLMRATEAMRQQVLTKIQERDLEASKAGALARRESRRATGRSSTILSR